MHSLCCAEALHSRLDARSQRLSFSASLDKLHAWILRCANSRELRSLPAGLHVCWKRRNTAALPCGLFLCSAFSSCTAVPRWLLLPRLKRVAATALPCRLQLFLGWHNHACVVWCSLLLRAWKGRSASVPSGLVQPSWLQLLAGLLLMECMPRSDSHLPRPGQVTIFRCLPRSTLTVTARGSTSCEAAPHGWQ